jgi:3-oxoacyl-[acyl-carrier protein] reductase
MSKTFQGTAAVVTGASSGIGRAIAIGLARAGVERLLVHYRHNQDGAEETATQLRELGCESSTVAADLSRSTDREQLIKTAFGRLGVIQTWVNNAGADVLTGDAASIDFESKLRLLLDVDVIGTIDLSRALTKQLMDQETEHPPSLTFIGWDQAPQGMEGDAGQMFGPVKAAVMAFAASLAQDVAPKLRVNTVAPGWIQTSWGESTSDYWDQRAKQQSLMQRWGRPEDVAKAVVYAATPPNDFLVGQTINVNGGWNRKPTL